jgi:hypothetical protein
MFAKEENGEKKFRINAIFYVVAKDENEALNSIKKCSIEDADEKRITQMRRS